jgi:hypothetical protein
MSKMRDVDWVIEYTARCERINPVVKQVLLNRLIVPMSREEIDRARYQLRRNEARWDEKPI